MSDDSRLGGARGRLRPVAGARRGKVGDPNVLSGAAIPNRLSDQAQAPKSIPVSTGTITAPPRPVSTPAATRTATAPRPIAQSSDDAPARGRLPSLPSLIFIGFLVLTGIRLVNEFAQDFGGSEPTTSPTTQPAGPRQPGPVTFGTDMTDDCDLSGPAATFAVGTDVWWLAEMPTRMSKDTIVVVRVLLNHDEVDRDEWPPDGQSFWTVMCDGPVSESAIGNYRIEVWNEDSTVLHAAGEYQIR